MEEGGGKAGKALDRELAIVSSVCLKSCGSTARVTCCGEVLYLVAAILSSARRLHSLPESLMSCNDSQLDPSMCLCACKRVRVSHVNKD